MATGFSDLSGFDDSNVDSEVEESPALSLEEAEKILLQLGASFPFPTHPRDRPPIIL
jgi:hypothetical protein